MMRRALILLSLVGTLLPLWTVPSWACSCAMASPRQQARWADVVFTGRVQAITFTAGSPGQLAVSFAPELLFKGSVGDVSTVTTASDGAACGFHFEEGRRYTVFAEEHRGRLGTHLCSATTAGDIDAARFGLEDPVAIRAEPVDVAPRSGWPLGVAAGGLILVVAAGLVLLRGRARA